MVLAYILLKSTNPMSFAYCLWPKRNEHSQFYFCYISIS